MSKSIHLFTGTPFKNGKTYKSFYAEYFLVMLDNSKLTYVTDSNQAAQLALMLCIQPVLGLDTETTGLDPYTSELRLVQLATLDGRVYVFDMRQVSLSDLAPLFGVPMAVHNAAFEHRFLHPTQPQLLCTMLAGRLTHHRNISLADLSREVLGWQVDKTEQTGDWSGELARAQIEYAGIDALAAVRLIETLLPRIDQAGQRELFNTWCKVVPVLGDLYLQGQTFDWDAHSQLVNDWEIEKADLEFKLWEQLGKINLNSGPQIADWLTNNLDSATLQRWPKTPKGRLKTNADTLQLFGNLLAVAPLLAYKKISKLISTYGKSYTDKRHPVTGRLHPEFRLGNTVSGRVTAQGPNTQQPPRIESFRKLFIPAPGRVLVGADFSQIELRVAALLSQDPAMMAAYAQGEDLHVKTAAAIVGVPVEQVTQEQRQAAKAVNFGNLYGQGPKGLVSYAKTSYGVDMTPQESKQALRRFSSTYPMLAYWQKLQVANAQMLGQVKTRLGLVRDFAVQGTGYLKGESMNVPVQGSAAEVLLCSLAQLPQALTGIDAQLYHNVHDEIILDVTPGHADQAARVLQETMQAGFLEVFPEGGDMLANLVEVHIGNNWAEVH